MNLKKLFFASSLLFAACGTIQAQEVIAHRGFWTTDGSAQRLTADAAESTAGRHRLWIQRHLP